MKYSVDWLKEKYDANEKIKFLFFWGHQPSKDGTITSGCFSQWWPVDFTVDGITYKSAEHFMMAEKARLFEDKETLEKIISCNKPAEAKTLGREVRNFDETIWLKNRYDIVLKGSINKFSQNDILKKFLLNTSGRVIVEASPVDRIWGIGLTADHKNAQTPHHWNGFNLLGFALMEARDLLKT